MFIKNLTITDFRNIKSSGYDFTNQVNVFYGNNGVGKTSILESIHFLSTGKSFRKGSYKNLIRYNADKLTVHLSYHYNDLNHTLAVSKNQSGQWLSKLNNKNNNKQSNITNKFPVVSIDPEVYRLVDFGPLYRRNFLDWLVFHVKHDYLVLWKKTYKCIKQLNNLYKTKAENCQIAIWEQSFIKYSTQLNTIRESVFNSIIDDIKSLTSYMQDDIRNISITFKKGWSEELTLLQQLENDRSKNLLYGKLLHGPHKMDIDIKVNKFKASQTLSRGQKKILSICFYMAYINHLIKNKISPILCLDDLDAELDEIKLKKAAEFFINTKAQIFITSVTENKIKKSFPCAEMFHVKH